MNGKVLSNRYSLIASYVKDKTVLDLGCVDHEASTEKTKELWLHKFVKEHAKDVVGVDFEKKEVEKLNKKGYNIVVDNVETMDLKKKFDVVLAGELIEHLSNVGLFLNSVKKHMNKDSVFIFTTPNAFAIRRMFRNFAFGNNPNVVNHTCYFDAMTLFEHIERANLDIVEWYYFFDTIKPIYKYWIEKPFSVLRPVFSPNLLFVLRVN